MDLNEFTIGRRDGKPKQQVDVSGGLMHAYAVYRDPRLANLGVNGAH